MTPHWGTPVALRQNTWLPSSTYQLQDHLQIGQGRKLNKRAWLQKLKFAEEGVKDRHKNGDGEKTEDEGEPVGLCDRLMFVSTLFGVEMCMAFEQIYEILFLQFLGVPLALVSMAGIISGSTSMVFLPIVGVWADGGPNPKRRKLITLVVGVLTFLTGLLMLVGASLIKIHHVNAVATLSPTSSPDYMYPIWLTNLTGNTSSEVKEFDALIGLNQTDEDVLQASQGMIKVEHSAGAVQGVTALTFLPIIGFTCLDIGFDMTVSLSRASILENVPRFQHTSVLVLATIVHSTAGCLCSLLGCFDWPGLLGPLFHADGTAATLIFFCCVLITVTLVGFFLMGLANFRMAKRNEKCPPSFTSDCIISADSREELIHGVVEKLKISTTLDCLGEQGSIGFTTPENLLGKIHESQLLTPNSAPTVKSSTCKIPLLLEDGLKTNYCSINADDNSSGSMYGSDPQNIHQEVTTTGIDAEKDKSIHGDANETLLYTSSDSQNPEEPFFDTYEGEGHEESDCTGISSVLEVIGQPYSMALSQRGSLLHLSVEDTTEQPQEDLPKLGSKEWDTRQRQMKKKLIIICVSSFFAIGTAISFSVYSANLLNVGILHGDPSAPPGTEGRQQYEKGLRFGAVGNLIMYFSFALVSLANTRIIDTVGEKGQYILNHMIMIVGLVALVASKCEEVYMVCMICCGIFRPCLLTLPFVLAHKCTQEGMITDNVNGGKTHNGRVMTLMGFLIPAHYTLISVIMGPLMEATGNPWVPIYYSMGTASLSLGVFSLLFFI